MPTVRMPPLSLRRLTTLAAPPPTDADLVGRFVATRDDQAFAELVRRHGPAVLAVCRRVTGNPDDADDAFQATFLVLARKADRVRPAGAVGGWLYGVAVRAARAAVSRTARRRARETPVTDVPDVPDRSSPGPDPEVVRAVLEAVAGLSDAYRAAIVLCELEGRPRAVAARELGIPEGTLSSRLAAARRVLAARMRCRDLAALAAVAGAAAGPALAADARRLARASAVPSPKVEKLAEVVMRTVRTKQKLAALAAMLTVVGLAVGSGAGASPVGVPAPKPVRAAEPARLIVATAGEIHYLTPDGKELARLTGDQVKTAGVNVPTRRLVGGIGTNGYAADVCPSLAPHGRAAPDGRLPLATRGGLYLLSAGSPLAARPVKAAGGKPLFAGTDVPLLVAWSPDGRRAVGQRREENWLLPVTRCSHTLIDLEAGTEEPLPLPPEHQILDWAADGTWFLTLREDTSISFQDGWDTRWVLCRTSRDGKTVKPLASYPTASAVISPDGTRVAYQRLAASPVNKVRGQPICDGFEVAVIDLATGTTRVVATEQPGLRKPGAPTEVDIGAGLCWSPDGTELAYINLQEHGGPGRCRLRVGVCKADGSGKRTVYETAPAENPNGPSYCALIDWR